MKNLTEDDIMGNYIIQPCSMEHVKRYGEIYAGAFSCEPWNDHWKAADAEIHVREILEMEQAYGLEYVMDGEVIGFILGSSMLFSYGRTFEINDLAVDPAFQGKGIGTTLLERMLEDLKAQGMAGIHMITATDGYLPEFYEKYGFRKVTEVMLMGLEEEDPGEDGHEDIIKKRIKAGRDFIMKFNDVEGVPEDYETDQYMKKPQPPLAKGPMTGQITDLPKDFSLLDIDNDFLGIINKRKSHRVYTDERMSLTELSYLLWCTQGVKEVRGKAYATLRTVPSGGARHPFECYMAIRKVEGLEEGLYHYLPMKHQIEYLGNPEDMDAFLSESLCEQTWAAKASVVFYYSCVFYRAEWRYGIWAHGPVLMDAGHVTENLYLASESIGLGGCAIASVEPGPANIAFGLDGVEESVFYAMPVGTVKEEDSKAEADFYAFVKEEGL